MDKAVNRLIQEKSPYLLQHAHNPVDWYPWCEEAFAKAKREDKLVFLSIGYSTCHWCHVMERESFEDREVAAVLNRDFVCIKVDREERPDIDHIYMGVCQAMTGQGGWPLTVILTPAGKPFFAGTYFPKRANWMRAGLMNILEAVRERWKEERKEILGYSERLVLALQRQAAKPRSGKPLTEDILTKGFRQLAEIFEPNYGGFGGSPKFPAPHNLMFLLRYWRRSGEHAALRMVEKTLTAMWQGGIYDHLGYGFARYSTDGKWLIPHFEKMLYDNALLCYTYLEAYQCTDNEDYARVAEEILTYILRDMTDDQGGFYSAEDADSEDAEGRFYVFARHEILDVLGEHDGCIFADFYDVTGRGNFEHGVNVLHRIGRDMDKYAANMEMPRTELEELLDKGRRKLFLFRDKRVHPFKDDKILTAWNALMIAALAKAARVLNNDTYAAAGERALDFIFRRLLQDDGRLLARYRDGEAAHSAYLDDYAFLLWALLDMYETTFKLEYLRRAVTIAGAMKRLFWDAAQGGFYFYGADAKPLINRSKEFYDGALPSGNSVAAWALLKLAVLTSDSGLLELAERQIQAFSEEVARTPMAYAFFLTALDYHLSARRKVVIVGDSDSSETWAMLGAVGRRFLPDTAVMLSDVSEQHSVKADTDFCSELQEYQPVAGRPAAYICENFSCQPPVTELHRFLHELEEK